MSAFFDSNVILYLAQADARKAGIAENLLSRGGFASVQVLNELAHVARRKFRYEWAQVMSLISEVRELVAISVLTMSVHERGLGCAERYQLSVFDGMIVAAALSANCVTLWSEDMHDGLVIDGRLTIRNPFA